MTTNNVNNPPSALLASTRSTTPLAPRLTTSSTSQNNSNNFESRRMDQSEGARTNATPTGLQVTEAGTSSMQSMVHVIVHNDSSNSLHSSFNPTNNTQTNHTRNRTIPRPLLHGTGQTSATQALSTDPSPSTSRFAAYLPQPGRGSNLRTTHSSIRSDGQTGEITNTSKRSSEIGSKFEILPQFRIDASLRGDVLIRCSDCDFYVHKAVLYFASPFFRAILDGDWKETHPSLHTLSSSESSVDSTLTKSEDEEQSERIHEQLASLRLPASPRTSFHTAFFTLDSALDNAEATMSQDSAVKAYDSMDESLQTGSLVAVQDQQTPPRSISRNEPLTNDNEKDGDDSPNHTIDGDEPGGRLQRMATPPLPDHLERESSPTVEDNDKADKQTSKIDLNIDNIKGAEQRKGSDTTSKPHRLQKREHNLVAVIDLTEEDAATVQDFLCHVYPNLDLIVTWINIFPLFAFSDKFEVPFLRRACTTFLRASLAGRPIDAMALSERHGIEDVYREASRHVLDNMPSWETEELAILSSETLLKLERKRTWFLERLLKLGLANPARDYECHSACPDPQHCAKLLDGRWHTQYAAAFKYGPPQPSIIWRHLRELDGNGVHSQSMTMLACQSSSKAWVQSLFDRMYGLPTHGKTPHKFLAIKLINQPEGPSRQRQRAVTEGAEVTIH
jgi:BTB/POZ domain